MIGKRGRGAEAGWNMFARSKCELLPPLVVGQTKADTCLWGVSSVLIFLRG